VAQAIAGLLRLLPIHRARGQCYVPADLLASVGLSPAEFLADAKRDGSGAAVAAIVALGREHLSAFERNATSLPASLRPAYLPAALSGLCLGKAERLGAKALVEQARVGAFRKHIVLFNRARSGWR
jgi:phytoene synthase